MNVIRVVEKERAFHLIVLHQTPPRHRLLDCIQERTATSQLQERAGRHGFCCKFRELFGLEHLHKLITSKQLISTRVLHFAVHMIEG